MQALNAIDQVFLFSPFHLEVQLIQISLFDFFVNNIGYIHVLNN